MNWNTLDFVVRSLVSWFVRARHAESWIFRGAVAVLVAIHGVNWVFKYSGTIGGEPGSIEFGTAGAVPDSILWIITVVCITLMLGSAVWAWIRYAKEQQRLARKKVFVIEGRGLRDDDGSSLKSAVPESITGTRIDYMLDLRQRKDGMTEQAALDSLSQVVSTIAKGKELSRNTFADTVAVRVEHDGYRVALTKSPGSLLSDIAILII